MGNRGFDSAFAASLDDLAWHKDGSNQKGLHTRGLLCWPWTMCDDQAEQGSAPAATVEPAATVSADTASLAERLLCRTGTAWGLLKGQPLGVLLVWWLARHVVYCALTLVVLRRVRSPAGSGAVGAFFLLVHGTKLGMFLRSDAREQRTLSKRKESSIAIAAPCADAGAAP